MHDLKAVSSLFDLRGDFVHGYSYGSGHINDTYCIFFTHKLSRCPHTCTHILPPCSICSFLLLHHP